MPAEERKLHAGSEGTLAVKTYSLLLGQGKNAVRRIGTRVVVHPHNIHLCAGTWIQQVAGGQYIQSAPTATQSCNSWYIVKKVLRRGQRHIATGIVYSTAQPCRRVGVCQVILVERESDTPWILDPCAWNPMVISPANAAFAHTMHPRRSEYTAETATQADLG